MKAEFGRGQPELMRRNFSETFPRAVLIPRPSTRVQLVTAGPRRPSERERERERERESEKERK